MKAQSSSDNDINILNYALSLENLEAAFYTEGLQKYTSVDFANSSLGQQFGAIIGSDVFPYLSIIRDQEQSHVRTIAKTIMVMGGTPVAPCTYSFTYATPTDFLAVAAALENTGVMAYDGAVNMIQAASLKTSAAVIATVEARHAAYLNLLTGTSPFPDAVDTAKTMADVLAIASQFIVSCPTA